MKVFIVLMTSMMCIGCGLFSPFVEGSKYYFYFRLVIDPRYSKCTPENDSTTFAVVLEKKSNGALLTSGTLYPGEVFKFSNKNNSIKNNQDIVYIIYHYTKVRDCCGRFDSTTTILQYGDTINFHWRPDSCKNLEPRYKYKNYKDREK